MARIPRITAQIFAAGAANNGVFGSAQAGTKVISNSLPTIMGLAAWGQGWLSAVMGASKFPPLEEFQSVEYVHSTQIAYLLQQGIAEYDAATTYYINNVVMNPGTFQLWGSLTNANTGNALVAGANWQLLADFTATQPFTTGDAKLTFKTVADTGWVLANDGSIGDASSGATTRANADTAALFTLLWTNTSNANCPVSGGRGGSAAADFAAHKNLTIPQSLGRAIALYGSGSGLTTRALGFAVGEETHTLNAAESAVLTYNSNVTDPTHVHTNNENAGSTAVTGSGNVPQSNGGTINGWSTNAAATGITVATTANGGGGAHNNMQPTTFWNAMIKL